MQNDKRYTWSNISTTLVILLALLYGVEKMEHEKDTREALSTILTLEEQRNEFEVEVDTLGRQTAKQAVLLIDVKRDYDALSKQFTDLKKTKSQTRVVTQTRIDSIFVPTTIVDTLYLDSDSLPVYRFQKQDEWFSISAQVFPTKTLIENVSFNNTMTFSHRWERKNFLSKKTYFVEVNNTNPYLNISGLQNYEMQEEKRFYEQGKFWFAVGLGGGILLAK